ncbi:hypothetical protein [Tenacibaculum sp. 190524A02b]|uniref:hypothetical protein n=1 Tax=Tenacibaculum vairaonense TaxID=3137860 RepID=UPI0031FB3182
MAKDISERIEMIMKHFKENRNTFSKKIGLTNNVTIGRIINEDRKPSFDILNKIAVNYPEVDCNWLLTGKGKLIKEEKNVIVNSSTNDLNVIETLEFLLKHNETFLKDKSFKNYIKMNMEYLLIDEERDKKKKAIEELSKIASEKAKRENK